VLLGVQDHDVSVLIGAKLLVPLGKPAFNAPKYFAAVDVMERAANPKWLSTATKVIARYWRQKNGRKPVNRASQTSLQCWVRDNTKKKARPATRVSETID
jgi:hypothetical protein